MERQDDGDTIFGKASDFSYTTMKNLKRIARRKPTSGLIPIHM
jgi:hypothetical protein